MYVDISGRHPSSIGLLLRFAYLYPLEKNIYAPEEIIPAHIFSLRTANLSHKSRNAINLTLNVVTEFCASFFESFI
jgi:hypothetical protein